MAQASFYEIIQTSDINPTTSLPVEILKSSTSPLTLRAFIPEDAAVLTSILSNPENTKDDLSVATMQPTDIEALVHKWVTEAPSSPLTQHNLLVLVDGVVVGITGFGWIGPCKTQSDDNDASFVEKELAGAVGVVLNPEARRKGYGYEALRISIDYGLRELGLSEVRLGTTSRNVGMKGLMERKFGWVKTEVVEADRFGNDLLWRIGRGDLKLLNGE